MKILSETAIKQLSRMHHEWSGSRRGDRAGSSSGSTSDWSCYWGIVAEGGVSAYNASTKVLGKGQCILHHAPVSDEERLDTPLGDDTIPFATTVYSISGAYNEGDRVVLLQHIDGTLFILELASKRYAMTSSGGIPAATMSTTGGDITPGSASCSTYVWNGTVYSANGSKTIYNPWPDAIAGSRLISYSPDADGLLTIDAEACNAFA